MGFWEEYEKEREKRFSKHNKYQLKMQQLRNEKGLNDGVQGSENKLNLPCEHQKGDKVELVFPSGTIKNCEIAGVNFKHNGVTYDVYIDVREPYDYVHLLENIKAKFVKAVK